MPFALGVFLREARHLGGGFGHRLVDDQTALAPAGAIETIERDGCAIRAITPDAVCFFHGHEAAGAAAVFELDGFDHCAGAGGAAEACDDSKAMIFMDDDVADADIADFEQVLAAIARGGGETGIAADDFARGDDQPFRFAPAERQAHVEQLDAVEPAAVGFVPAGDGARALRQLARQAFLDEAQIVIRARDNNAGLVLEGGGDLDVHRFQRIDVGREADGALAVCGREIERGALLRGGVPCRLRHNGLVGGGLFLSACGRRQRG